MLSLIAAPLLAVALSQSTSAASCNAKAETAGVFPPPGCVVRDYQGTCYLQCETSPFLRTCEGD